MISKKEICSPFKNTEVLVLATSYNCHVHQNNYMYLRISVMRAGNNSIALRCPIDARNQLLVLHQCTYNAAKKTN